MTETSKSTAKLQFGKIIKKLILEKGWTQSELARRAGLPRDSVSVYVRGKSLPTPQSLHRLASALGVKAQELLPIENIDVSDTSPAFEVKVTPNNPGMAWVRFNQQVSMSALAKITEILSNDFSSHQK